MPNIWNLPPFSDHARFNAPDEAGDWKLPDSDLHDLGRSLRTNEDQAFQDQREPIRAIPDPWAQPITFAEALIAGKGHSMFDTALPQWRGLLASFALADLYSGVYTIAARTFTFGEDKLFDRVLGHLKPKKAIGRTDGDDEAPNPWGSPVIFSMEAARGSKVLVSWLGNPACLVSSGRLTADAKVDGVPWFKDGLTDPLECNLPLTQLVVLEAWLRNLANELNDYSDNAAARIATLVNEFADKCFPDHSDHNFEAEVGSSLFANLDKPLSALGKRASLKKPAQPWTNSQTKIRIAAPQGTPGINDGDLTIGALKGMILADPALAKDDRFDPNQTLVWGTRTLGEVIANPTIMEEVVLEAALHGWAVITADDLFADRVAKFGGDVKIPGNPAGAEEMLLPVRPIALLLGGQVQDRINVRSGGGSAVFTLKVPIEIPGEDQSHVELVRNYSTNPGANEFLLVEEEEWNVAHASVWPNIQSKSWREYFVRIVYPASERNDMVRPETGMSARLVASEIAAQENGQAAVNRLKQVNTQMQFTPTEDRWRLSPRNIGTNHDEMQFSPMPFDAIAYFDALSGPSAVYAGMAMLDLKPVEPTGGEFDVAIDFGSTNTVACIESRSPVKFEDRKIHPLVYRDPEHTKRERLASRWLFKRFYPADVHTTPSPTVALARISDTVDETHQMFRNLIYFHTHDGHAVNEETKEQEEFAAIRRSAHFNLKWSEDPVIAQASEDFLRQFMHMVALEALAQGRNPAKARWRFSIPDSMDRRLRLKFEDTLQEVTQAISTGVGRPEDVLKPLYSEGLAAANLILDAEAYTRGSINMVLDIGGSTTDVTIWDAEDLVWKGSFKVAGRNFFTSTISQNPDILEPIGLGHWMKFFDTEQTDQQTKDSHLAEMLFSGPALQEAIDRHWNKLRIQTGDHLRLTSLTFLGMIAWYLGKVARRLVEEGAIVEGQLESPAFALCGRGAGIFKKMHAGRNADAESEVTDILRVFSKAAGIEGVPRPQLFTTSVAKMEVVGGMIADNGQLDLSANNGAEEANCFSLSGLELTLLSGTNLRPDDHFSRTRLDEKVAKVGLEEFDAMCAAFEEYGHVKLDLMKESKQGAYTHIGNKVLRGVNKSFNEDGGGDLIESPFVTATRVVVHSLSSRKQDRDKLLKVSFAP